MRDSYSYVAYSLRHIYGGFIFLHGGFIFLCRLLIILDESAMTHKWIRHPKKRIRLNFHKSASYFLTDSYNLLAHSFKHMVDSFHVMADSFIYLAYSSFSTSPPWHIYESVIQKNEYTTCFHESASVLRGGFRLNCAWLLEIDAGFIIWSKNSSLFTCCAWCCLVVSCVVWCGLVLPCLEWPLV